jgi:hypothetical protein
MLLEIGRLLVSERLLSEVVKPTIADLQHEVAAARPERFGRLRARYRGYVSFWRVALIAPFASGVPRGAVARLAAGSIVFVLLALVGQRIDAWVSLVGAAATLFAVVMHWWYRQHPAELPAPPDPTRRLSPQIDFSSMEVGGNVGGLMFVVGSVFIVAVGLPSVIWFLFTALAAGSVVAWGLARWRTGHPLSGRPDKGIVLR